jgi:hypothetical protein
MRGAIIRASLLAAVAAGLFATAATSAPVPAKPPSISGHPNFTSVLTCNRGTWSPDAVSFDFAWLYVSGGPTIATGPTLHVPDTLIDYAIECDVTAHDAQGQTTSATSPGVTIMPAIPKVQITKATVSKRGVVTLQGVVGPSRALAKSAAGGAVVVLDRRINKTTVTQLAGPLTVRGRGKFKISGHDTRGRHTYVLLFNSAPGSGYAAQTTVNRILRVP